MNAICEHGVFQSACGQCADMDEESYASLADEMNDPDAPVWNEDDWDNQAVKEAKRHAKKNGLSWPPRIGDYDRWYERKYNNR